jgi:hypothetical protein
LRLGHLLIDVHELAEVVAGLATQRADPQVGQVQLVPSLLLELVEGGLGQEVELADQAAGRRAISGSRSEPKTTRQTSRITRISPSADVEQHPTSLQPADRPGGVQDPVMSMELERP